ncbi:MAG: flagellar M-ring protein FliF C-terminal domain-containing protein [Tepidisphaeraceae bacterium]|jgi:flagellar biosynthesis/type III secretory pathway M-ring protein FliF/YscJ
MDFLKVQFTRIQEQLGGLSATQKMLVVSLLTIMVMTLLWWSHWAAEPEMSPLLDQSLSTEDVGLITANLDARDIPHQVVGDKVMVPADRKMEVLAVLGYSNALPKDFDKGFDEIIKQMNWLDPPDKTDQMFLRAKEQTLAGMIRRWPGVAEADVVIDPSVDRHIGDNDVQPVATVTITAGRSNKLGNRQLAESAAAAVCGAQPGLERSHVNVIIDGVSIAVKDHSEDGMDSGGDGVQMQQQYEEYYRKKIEAALEDIRGVMVSVTVKVDTSQTTTTIHKVDPKQTVSVPMQTEETSQEQNAQAASAQEEPGAMANTSLSLPASGGGGGGGSTNSTEKNEFKSDYGNQDEVIKQGAGTATVASASVRVPRSYFIQAYKIENGGKDPDDPAALKTYMDAQLQKIHNEVKGCAVFPSDDALFVETYSDVVQPELPLGQETAASPMTTALGKHGKEVGVGVLAVISLLMVMMMVRKGGGAPATTTVAQPLAPAEAPTLNGNEAVVGSAAENSESLDGMELDEETVKGQQVLDQVQKMVTANPDAAASLVKRWLNH